MVQPYARRLVDVHVHAHRPAALRDLTLPMALIHKDQSCPFTML